MVSIALLLLGACHKGGQPGFSSLNSEMSPKGGGGSWQLITGEDPEDDRRQWDQIYKAPGYVFGKEPSDFLKEQLHLLPLKNQARVLDIAMGEGRNAVFLAKQGFDVEGVDLSEVAIEKANRLARENHVSIRAIEADLNQYVIKPESYDVILNIDYLQRNLIPQMKKGLKHGGILVFENDTVKQLANPGGKNTQRSFLLEEGELANLFKDFKVLVYHEHNDGRDARASLVAQKP
jgi:tellurite methyltransferase